MRSTEKGGRGNTENVLTITTIENSKTARHRETASFSLLHILSKLL
jgi:hypothetical protein